MKTTISEVLSSTFLRIQPHSSFWSTLTCQQIVFSCFQNTWLCSSFWGKTFLAFLKNSNLKLLCYVVGGLREDHSEDLRLATCCTFHSFIRFNLYMSNAKHMKTSEPMSILVPKIGDKAVADLAGGSLGLAHETIPVWAVNRGWLVWWNCA